MLDLATVVFVGCGAITRAVLPILLSALPTSVRFIAIDAVSPDSRFLAYTGGRLHFMHHRLSQSNLRDTVTCLLDSRTCVLNLSTGVSSIDLMTLCRERGALYLDTCIAPWDDGYADPDTAVGWVTNKHLRSEALGLRETDQQGPTAILAHGANPGLISHFVKRAILVLAQDAAEAPGNDEMPGETDSVPESPSRWAALARRLGISMIHIAEHDTQRSLHSYPTDTFVNTWSAAGLIEALRQPSEFGIGTREWNLPGIGRTDAEQCYAAAFDRSGVDVRIKTWTPEGPCEGYLVTHNESLSLAEYLTCRQRDAPMHRPTVCYAYRPCEVACKSITQWNDAGKRHPDKLYVLQAEDVIGGADHLGALLITERGRHVWYGSTVSIADAKRLMPFNTATTLRVAAGVYAGMMWALRHPMRGIVEAEEMDHEEVLADALPYLADLRAVFTEWHPGGAMAARQDGERRAILLSDCLCT